VSASFPEVILNKENIEEILPPGLAKDERIALVLVHDSIRYPVSVQRSGGDEQTGEPSPLRGDSIIEFGPTFLSTWRPTCPSIERCDPRIELWLGGQQLGSAPIPQLPWDSRSQMRGTFQTTDASVGHNELPIAVAMKSLKSLGDFGLRSKKIAVIRMMFSVANPSMWNRFVAPYKMIEVHAGDSYTLRWSCAFEAQRTFRISFMKRSPAVTDEGNTELLLTVGKNTVFREINGTAEDLTINPVGSTFNDYAINMFEYTVTFDKQQFAVDDEIIAALRWVDAADITHKMNSNPIVIVSDSAPISDFSAETGRGEAADEALGDKQAKGNARRQLQELHDLNQDGVPDEQEYGEANEVVTREKEIEPECVRKDLNFAIGTGLLIRAEILHLSLPLAGFGAMNAMDDEQPVRLPWKNVLSWNSHEKDFKDYLPELLCRGGACSSTLPGCSQASHSEKKYWPELHIEWNKELTFDEAKTKKGREVWEAIRKVMAYGFAILPEAVSITFHALNGTHLHMFPNPASEPAPVWNLPPQRHNVQSGEVACEGHNFDARACASVGCCIFSSADEACHSAVGQGPCYKEAPTTTLSSLSGNFPAGPQIPVTPLPPTPPPQRRLREVVHRVTNVTVRFEEGLRYNVDRKLMDEMLRRGLFNFEDHDNNDPHHPLHGLFIQSYEITGSDAREGDYEEADSLVSIVNRTRHSTEVGVILAAIVSTIVLGVGAVLWTCRKRSYRPVKNQQGAELAMEELAIE